MYEYGYGLLGGSVALLLFVIVLIIAVYVLYAFAEFKLLRAFNYPNAWFAFVPFLGNYALGDVCTQTTGGIESVVTGLIFPNFVLQFGWVLNIVLQFIPAIGGILGIVWSVIYFGTICDFLYKRVEGQDNKVLACISGWLMIILWIKILSWRLPAQGYQFRSAPTDVYPFRNPVTGQMGFSFSGVGKKNVAPFGQQVNNGQQFGNGQQMNNGYGQPINNSYNQQMDNGYNQQMNNGYGQPMNNGYGQPMNNGYNQQFSGGQFDGSSQPMNNGQQFSGGVQFGSNTQSGTDANNTPNQ